MERVPHSPSWCFPHVAALLLDLAYKVTEGRKEKRKGGSVLFQPSDGGGL